jgi:hypothetical protein
LDYVGFLAVIVAKSFEKENAIFCCLKTATAVSSFLGLQKKYFANKLEADSTIGF